MGRVRFVGVVMLDVGVRGNHDQGLVSSSVGGRVSVLRTVPGALLGPGTAPRAVRSGRAQNAVSSAVTGGEDPGGSDGGDADDGAGRGQERAGKLLGDLALGEVGPWACLPSAGDGCTVGAHVLNGWGTHRFAHRGTPFGVTVWHLLVVSRVGRGE